MGMKNIPANFIESAQESLSSFKPHLSDDVFKAMTEELGASYAACAELQERIDAVQTMRQEFAKAARALTQLSTHGPDNDLRHGMQEITMRMFRVLGGLSPSALDALKDHDPKTQEVVVKPLEWRQNLESTRAELLGHRFFIEPSHVIDHFKLSFEDGSDYFPTIEAAKRAAQVIVNRAVNAAIVAKTFGFASEASNIG